MKFSQRIGLKPLNPPLQLDSIDNDLRNTLWNILSINLIEGYQKYVNSHYQYETTLKEFCISLWHTFYKLPIDEMPKYTEDLEKYIRKSFFKFEWFEVYEFLEFIINFEKIYLVLNLEQFKIIVNKILEKESSGYRIVNNIIAPITNEIEIKEIQEALNVEFSIFKPVNIQLNMALKKMSDRDNPDYRNSIKESISAIESTAKILIGDSKATLGGALSELKKKGLNSVLLEGYNKLYGYTSSADGIRHGLMEESNCDFDDAKYMLVASSAFINYLVSKGNKMGLLDKK